MKSINVQRNFGYRVRGLRLEKKLSQEKLAILMEMDRTYASRIERGLANVSLKTLVKLSEVLEVEIGEMMRDVATLDYREYYRVLLNEDEEELEDSENEE